MDGLSSLPPENAPRLNRIRTISVNSLLSVARMSTSHGPEIHSPIPRRQFLDSGASHWVDYSQTSPNSSRAVSPTVPSSLTNSRRFSSLSANTIKFFDTLKETGAQDGRQALAASLLVEKDAELSMARRWLRWMHKRGMKSWVLPCVLLASTFVRACMSLGSYSGHSTPPMFGDYEAQRHWMELTVHLPILQWYTYDLQYWGLDYPPLTAYVSWLCGIVGHWIDPAWVALDTSRGIESASSKVFMRSTVLVLDAIVYVTALVMFSRTWLSARSSRSQNLALIMLLFQPALLLIDFGHFQYNSVMLGLALLAINCFVGGRDLLGAGFFVLSLGFKQMALYYAPAIGGYLLAKCVYLGPVHGLRLFVRLALVTSLAFLLVFLPFLPPFAPVSAILHPISRIFPFGRGLFEDKVANFWCASNVAFKWKNWASPAFLVKLSAAFTALGFLPNIVVLLRVAWQTQLTTNVKPPSSTPILPLLPYAMLTSSMSFFLFSFQVHEKTILLPLLPITLLLSVSPIDSAVYGWGVLANNVAVFSMWPLLQRDGLAVQYIAMLAFWNRLIGYNPLRLPTRSVIQLVSITVYAAAFGLHVLELLMKPPARYPDLFAVLNVLISTPVFVLVWLWSIKSGFEMTWAVGRIDIPGSKSHRASSVGPNDRPVSRARNISLGTFQGRKRIPFGSEPDSEHK